MCEIYLEDLRFNFGELNIKFAVGYYFEKNLPINSKIDAFGCKPPLPEGLALRSSSSEKGGEFSGKTF